MSAAASGGPVDDGLVVEGATVDEVRLALDWAAREGWNPGLSDASCFRAADPDGFLAGRIANRTVATISAVRYGQDFGFIGLYIVDPAFRGRGIGTEVWASAMARLEGAVIGLDGVVAMQHAYARSGFVLAHRSIRYGGRRGPGVVDAGTSESVAPGQLDEVLAYDSACFGVPRPSFLTAWLAQPGVVVRLAREQGRVSGYGVLRPCRSGFKVGPLFADHADTAEALLSSLFSTVPEQAEVFLDVPEPNTDARRIAERHGLSPVFETARMYRGADPGLPIGRVFGITSFELG